MKILSLLCVSFLYCLPLSATTMEANGHILYNSPDNGLMTIPASLSHVPDGDVTLTVEGHDPIVAKKYYTRKRDGRTMLNVIFQLTHHESQIFPADFAEDGGMNAPKKYMVLTGSYIRATNQSVYYGDLYGAKGKGRNARHKKIHKGGFFFSATGN